MKKIYIVLAVIGTALLSSCVKEKSFEEVPLQENEFRLALYGSASTRSQELMQPRTFSFLAGKVESTGNSFYLEEVVEDLNYVSPATKGTPAYTENVAKLYHNLTAIVKSGDTEKPVTFYAMDDAQQEGAGWRYRSVFEWEEDEYDFYMMMPDDLTGLGVSNLAFDNKTITFDYNEDNVSATELEDLIFAARTITKAEAETNRVNGVPVLFHHALTGVKFRIVNNDELELDDSGKPKGKDGRTQTYISKVTIKGLKNSGTCVITPREETQGYVDDPTDDYSSGDGTFTSGVVAWTYNNDDETGAPSTGTFTQTFSDDQNLTKYSGSTTTTYTTTTTEDGKHTTTGSSVTGYAQNGNYPGTFSGAGNKNNLNDGDASMTFWFIPQALTEDVTIEVEFHVWDGDKDQETNKLTLKLGEEVLKKTGDDLALTRDWKAGQLRTFSLKPLHVDVEIDDELDTYVKSNVYIKNTGNVTQYVRVYITGNWMGKRQISEGVYNTDESVLMGYTSGERNADGTYKSSVEVARWNDKDFTWNGNQKVFPDWSSPSATYHYTPYGEFTDLPPMGTTTSGGTMVHYWVRHDKFYYYTKPIGPGDDVPDSDPLFSKYEVDKSPDFWIADNTGVRRLAGDVHLVMDLMVQAIECPLDNNGQPTKTYSKAWADELGVTEEKLNDL